MVKYRIVTNGLEYRVEREALSWLFRKYWTPCYWGECARSEFPSLREAEEFKADLEMIQEKLLKRREAWVPITDNQK